MILTICIPSKLNSRYDKFDYWFIFPQKSILDIWIWEYMLGNINVREGLCILRKMYTFSFRAILLSPFWHLGYSLLTHINLFSSHGNHHGLQCHLLWLFRNTFDVELCSVGLPAATGKHSFKDNSHSVRQINFTRAMFLSLFSIWSNACCMKYSLRNSSYNCFIN